jgi:hypothetical protein
MTINTVAAEVIADCRRRGIMLSSAGPGVKCTAPKGVMTPDLAAAVKVNRDDIRRLLLAEAERTRDSTSIGFGRGGQRTQASTEWPASTGAAIDYVLLLTPEDMPPAPFDLRQGSVVVDAGKFLRAVQADIRTGPRGPRAGTVHDDVQRLRDLALGLN